MLKPHVTFPIISRRPTVFFTDYSVHSALTFSGSRVGPLDPPIELRLVLVICYFSEVSKWASVTLFVRTMCVYWLHVYLLSCFHPLGHKNWNLFNKPDTSPVLRHIETEYK